MNKVSGCNILEKTSSGLALYLVGTGFLLFTMESEISTAELSKIESETSHSLVMTTHGDNAFSNSKLLSLRTLKDNLNDLWNSIDENSFSPTAQELEVAEKMLTMFPNNTL